MEALTDKDLLEYFLVAKQLEVKDLGSINFANGERVEVEVTGFRVRYPDPRPWVEVRFLNDGTMGCVHATQIKRAD